MNKKTETKEEAIAVALRFRSERDAAREQADKLAEALRDCAWVLDLPAATHDAFGTTYTTTQRSGTVAKAKIKAREAIAAYESEERV